MLRCILCLGYAYDRITQHRCSLQTPCIHNLHLLRV